MTGTKQDAKGLEGIFRFLESRRVSSAAVAAAVFKSTGLAAAQESRIFVPIDQTDLTALSCPSQYHRRNPQQKRAKETAYGRLAGHP